MELHAGEGLSGYGIHLVDDKSSSPLVPEGQRLSLADLDRDGLGRAVEKKAVQRPGFLCGNDRAGFQVGNGDAAILIRGIVPVIGSHDGTPSVYNQKFNALHGLVGAIHELLDGERGRGIILKREIVPAGGTAAGNCATGNRSTNHTVAAGAPAADGAAAGPAVAGAVLHNDGLGRGIQDVALGDLGLGDHHGASGLEAGHSDRSVRAGGVAAQERAVSISDCELRSGDWPTGDRIHLFEGQTAQGVIVIAIGSPPLLLLP